MNMMSRMRVFGLSLLVLALVGPSWAEEAKPAELSASHFVPVEKGLSDAWVKGLYERGAKETYKKDQLSFIGMPVGGIGCGQLYLCGDGTLGNWEIFNRYEYLGTGEMNYMGRVPTKPVDQGFAVVVEQEDGQQAARSLNAKEWADVQFNGTYPIGTVKYSDQESPVSVEMEAFSPFIPLNAEDSALPATVFNIKVKNTSDKALKVRCLGWLENAVCFKNAQDIFGAFRTTLVTDPGRSLLVHSAENVMGPMTPVSDRPAIMVQDFEGEDYGTWKAEGEAFGAKPATGGMEAWQHPQGFEGKGFVNSFLRGDSTTGKLSSPAFKIERQYINFLIGGGHYRKEMPLIECVNLVVDGKVVASSTGEGDDQLRWESWDVSAYEGQEGVIEIIDSRPFPTGGYIMADQFEMSDEKRRKPTVKFEEMEDYGTMALGFAGDVERWSAATKMADTLSAPTNKQWQSIGKVYWFKDGKRSSAMMSKPVEIAAGAEETYTFVLAWHFPNSKNGYYYTNRFETAQDVATYVLDNNDRLAGQTRQWRDTYYDSTLPYWLLDRLHSTVSTLATGTCQWWKNGRFWAWEGVVSCPGTCTHVWNYSQAEARLFPQLTRSVREMQDFNPEPEGGFVAETGMVGFRGCNDKNYAADGQCGAVLKAYREHLISANDEFLKKNYPNIKKALEFMIVQDGKDSTPDDGMIENSQPNTYDIAFEGANTLTGSLYLAALRAGEEMARAMGDTEFADKAHKIFESGQKLTVERLWDGEYFIQDVDLAKHPANQYGPGCLADQLFGQTWAHEVGLGYVYPTTNVKSALESIWKYNWAPDVGPQNKAHAVMRTFAAPGEAGLFVLTWPKSDFMDASIFYKSEVWSGIEYQVAANMIREGMTDQGLSICRGIHDRYQPSKRNPYSEVECGDHYARAMASWGVLTALGGFEYDGPDGHIGFAPRVTPEDFKTVFTAGEGWGTFAQKRDGKAQQEALSVKWGQVPVKTLAFAVPEAKGDVTVTVKSGDKVVPAKHTVEKGRVLVTLDEGVTLKQDETLDVTING